MTYPVGKPFSRVYGSLGPLTKESRRLRVRLFAYLKALEPENWFQIVRRLELDGGVSLNSSATDYWKLSSFFEEGTTNDVLDAITYIYRSFSAGKSTETPYQADWREHVTRALAEEGLAYSVDDRCGVRYIVDEEFERSRIAAIAELQMPALAPVLGPVENAFKHLDAHPADTKAAIRSIFEAVEVLAKIIDPRIDKLNKAVAKGWLKEAYLDGVNVDTTERAVIDGMFDSLSIWVNSLHAYRHGQNVVGVPSDELAIFVIASGCSYIRWLAPRAAIKFAVSRPDVKAFRR